MKVQNFMPSGKRLSGRRDAFDKNINSIKHCKLIWHGDVWYGFEFAFVASRLLSVPIFILPLRPSVDFVRVESLSPGFPVRSLRVLIGLAQPCADILCVAGSSRGILCNSTAGI